MFRTLVANSLWLGSAAPGFVRFRQALPRPEQAQQEVLARLLRNNQHTAYGRKHAFDTIRNSRDFNERVPIINYEDLEPWIDRIRAGEQQVLTKDRVTHFIPTSGSTAARKLIPFTAALQVEFNRAIDPWIFDLYRKHPNLTLGPAYWSITPLAEIPESDTSAIPIGFEDDSAYLGGWRKSVVSALMALPSEVRLIKDIEIFRYVTLLCLLRQSQLRLISVWHPSFLTLLLDDLKGHWADLLDDIRGGGCLYAAQLPPQVRGALDLSASAERARQLNPANPDEPQTVWPRLKVISCWGDAQAAGALANLQRRFRGVTFQRKGLLATEAFVSLPFRGAYPLAIRSHFFEFIDDAGKIHLAHGLQEGGEYEVIVSTAGGLYRYRLGDRIRVDGFIGKTPSIRFLGRSGNISDRYGEKISEAFAGAEIQKAVFDLSEPPIFMLLAPEEYPEGIAYVLFFEITAPNSETDLQNLADRLETALCENPQYRYARRLGQLLPARVYAIPERGYEIFVRHAITHGKRLGEIKPTSLSSETGWAGRFAAAESFASNLATVR